MNPKDSILASLQKIIGLKDEDIELQFTTNFAFGDYSTNLALKNKDINPEETVKKLLEDSILKQFVSEIKIVNRFINFYLKEDYLVKNLENIDENYGKSEIHKGKRIMVEFAHPNPFKSFHIGHLRNIILGESIVRLLESQGAEVIRTNYQGDVGMHIAKCLWAFKKIDPQDYPTGVDERVAFLGKLYAEGATAFEDNEETKNEIKEINKLIYARTDVEVNTLWQLGKDWSLAKFHEIYKRLYTTFEREYMESEVLEDCKKYIDKAIAKKILTKSEGAVIFDGPEYDLDTRVFLNSEGLPTYEGKELGLAYREFSDFGKIDLCIHNVAVEQISFFKVTFKVEELLDPEIFKGKQYHNAYEFVGLKKGKMSSRKGNVILGNDILNDAYTKITEIVGERKVSKEDIEKIAVAAIKYSFLKISPFQYLAFDMEESVTFDGNSGPYIQYTFARTQSVLGKVKGKGQEVKECKLNPEELRIAIILSRFSEVISMSAKLYSPNLLCDYLFDLAQAFNGFYQKHKIIDGDNASLRIKLTQATGQVLKTGLTLLGIQAPSSM